MRRRLLGPSVVVLLLAGVTLAPSLGPAVVREPGLITGPVERSTAPNGASDPALGAADRLWLASGTVPGSGTPHEAMATAALLDLRDYVQPDGAVAAGPGGPWRYTWPRDASFVALALARTGHLAQARAVLGHLAGFELVGGVGFAARYHPDGSPVQDGRPAQSDGCGWVLWALEQVRAAAPSAVPSSAVGLRERCTDSLLALVDDGSRLPAPTPDYWELPVDSLTLGVAAPVLAGLQASARDHVATGDLVRSVQVARAAAGVAALVQREFGPTYHRYGLAGGLDASVAMLMPPFSGAGASSPAAGVRGAWEAYQREALRPAGGLAPGSRWPEPGNSWTPETALVAYTAAATGDRADALHWLGWLDAHRTAYGSLPEKVTRTGRPAGPAPLLWTSALVLLALDRLDHG